MLFFVREVLDQNITDEAFKLVFKEFDQDKNGTIDRDEIALFINKMAKNDEPNEADATKSEARAKIKLLKMKLNQSMELKKMTFV